MTTDPTPPAALTILGAVNPRKLTAPGVDELLEKNHEHFPFLKTFEDARWEPLLAMCVCPLLLDVESICDANFFL